MGDRITHDDSVHVKHAQETTNRLNPNSGSQGSASALREPLTQQRLPCLVGRRDRGSV